MMAISDENGLWAHQAGNCANHRMIMNGPKPADGAEVVGGFHGKCLPYSFFKLGHHFAIIIWVKPKYWAEVHVGSLVEFKSICFWACKSFFVGEDFACAKRLESDPCHESFAQMGFAFNNIFLFVNIKCGGSIAD